MDLNLLSDDLVLRDPVTILRKLTSQDFAALAELALEREIWQPWHGPIADASSFKQLWFDKAIKQMNAGERFPFVIINDNTIVGSTSFYDISPKNKKLAVGYTWIAPSYWGSGLNQRCKYLLLQYVFETMKWNKISAHVDSINLRSCQALRKIGFQQDGILREDLIRPDGSWRDTVVFSLLQEEWTILKTKKLTNNE